MRKIIIILSIILTVSCFNNLNVNRETKNEQTSISQETKEVLGKLNKNFPLQTCGFQKMNVKKIKYIN